MVMILIGQNLNMRPAAAMLIASLSEIAVEAARQGSGSNHQNCNP